MPTMEPKAVPYPEHDKLGPFGAKSSALDDAAALRGVLVRAFEAAVHQARDAVNAVDQDAATAVHSARKALRRARAVLGLVAPVLPKAERRAVKAALQGARRALSTQRDHAVAPEALAELPLDAEDRETADGVLANAAAAIPPAAELKQLLAESAARAAAQAEALQAALPPEIDWATVVTGLGDIYRQARRASRGAHKSKARFHTWRRRGKELVYQLELIAGQAGPRIAAIRDEVAEVTGRLGPAVDLIMMREYVATHGQGIPPEAVRRLRGAIDRVLEKRMASACKEGRDSFRQRTRKLEKRITKAARRDLAPADEGPHDRETQG